MKKIFKNKKLFRKALDKLVKKQREDTLSQEENTSNTSLVNKNDKESIQRDVEELNKVFQTANDNEVQNLEEEVPNVPPITVKKDKETQLQNDKETKLQNDIDKVYALLQDFLKTTEKKDKDALSSLLQERKKTAQNTNNKESFTSPFFIKEKRYQDMVSQQLIRRGNIALKIAVSIGKAKIKIFQLKDLKVGKTIVLESSDASKLIANKKEICSGRFFIKGERSFMTISKIYNPQKIK